MATTERAGLARAARAAGFATAGGAAVLALYVLHPAIQGFRFPIGPDGPVYTWLARLAGVEGFEDAPGAGPGVPALALVLGRLLGTEPLETVMVLGVVLAATVGLAGGAVLEAALGDDRLRTGAAIALTGAFAAYLAGGWLANLAMVAIFLAAIAALAAGAARSRTVWLAGGLLLAAGLAHRWFGIAGAAILLLAAFLDLVTARRERRSAGVALGVAGAALGGQGTALLIGAWIASGAPVPGDTSQDGFFRRVGLRELLLDRYRERFLGDAARSAVPLATGLGLAAAWPALAARRESSRLLGRFLVAWAALTGAGVVFLAATGWGPPYRVMQFAFFVPLAAAGGLAVIARRSQAHAVAAGLAAVAFVAFSLVGWFRQAPAFSSAEAGAVARLGAAVASLDPSVPVVVLVDTDERAAAYHVTRAWNLIRTGVPPTRIRDVRVAVGQPRDFLTGLPTHTGDLEHDRIADAYRQEAEPLLDRAAVVVVRDLNPAGYASALRLEDSVVVSDGVVALTRGEELARTPSAEPPSGLGAATLFLLALASLVALGALGGGWTAWALGGAASLRGIVLAAPSVGAAVAILGAVLTDRAGVQPSSPGALVLVLAFGAAGYVLAVRR